MIPEEDPRHATPAASTPEDAVILVAGATGHVGSEVCRLLVEQGHTVRGMVRPTSDSARVSALMELGVQVVEGDLREPDTLARVCSGVSAVISTATAIVRHDAELSDVDRSGQIALIDAAAAAGAGHFVFVSFSGSLNAYPTPLGDAKRAAEQQLMASGMTWTILRPPAFMEVWLSPMLGFDVPNDSVTIYGDGGAPISYVSLFDVARFCVESLSAPLARNAIIEVGGPEAVTPLQAVRIAEDVTGRPIQVRLVPAEALRAQYEGAPDERQKSFAGLMCGLAAGDAKDPEETLRVFPFALRSVREHVAASFGPAPEADVIA
jgi:uncharacterized protein YbjT (DUF2867 family)